MDSKSLEWGVTVKIFYVIFICFVEFDTSKHSAVTFRSKTSNLFPLSIVRHPPLCVKCSAAGEYM